jgi:hypothetical protein
MGRPRVDAAQTRTLFLEDVSEAVHEWVEITTRALVEPDADLSLKGDPDAYRRVGEALRSAGVSEKEVSSVLLQAMYGLTHSLLAVIDGATAMAEVQRVYLCTDDSGSIGEGLHELLPEALKLDERLDELKARGQAS